MDADNNLFLFPNTPGGRDALRCELVRRKGIIAGCPASAVNWDGVAVFRRCSSLGADTSTKFPIKPIWRMRAKDRDAVARNTQRHANERSRMTKRTSSPDQAEMPFPETKKPPGNETGGKIPCPGLLMIFPSNSNPPKEKTDDN